MLISDLSDTQLAMLVLPILPNMWSLKHVFHHDFPTEKEKMRWLLACVFLPCIGGLAYIFVGRRHASKEKIDVFERYGKKEPAAQTTQEAPEAEPERNEVVQAVEETSPSEGRARAPWDDDTVVDSSDPRPQVKEWDFGCPDDVRKN